VLEPYIGVRFQNCFWASDESRGFLKNGQPIQNCCKTRCLAEEASDLMAFCYEKEVNLSNQFSCLCIHYFMIVTSTIKVSPHPSSLRRTI
jgi:hypothetical protein